MPDPTPPPKIGVLEALQLLRAQLAKRGPDFVYPHADDICSNWTSAPGGPHLPDCIVGHVLFDLAQQGRLDWGEVPQSADIYATNVDLGRPFDPEAVEVLEVAQDLQDRGRPWGFAVREAVERARDLGYDVPDETVTPGA